MSNFIVTADLHIVIATKQYYQKTRGVANLITFLTYC